MDIPASTGAGVSLTYHGNDREIFAVATNVPQAQATAMELQQPSTEGAKMPAHPQGRSNHETQAREEPVTEDGGDMHTQARSVQEATNDEKRAQDATDRIKSFSGVPSMWLFSTLDQATAQTPKTDAPSPQRQRCLAGQEQRFPNQHVAFRSPDKRSVTTPIQTQQSELDCVVASRIPISTNSLVPPQPPQEKHAQLGASSRLLQEPEHVTRMPRERPSNVSISCHERRSQNVILRVDPRKLVGPVYSRERGTSPKPTSVADEIPTPPDSQASSGEEASTWTPKTPTQRKQRENEQFPLGLYGRLPNPRRAATKAHRGMLTPPKQSIDPTRAAKSKAGNEVAASPQTLVKSRKRPSTDDTVSNGKRQKTNRTPTRRSLRTRTGGQAPSVMGQAVSTIEVEQPAKVPPRLPAAIEPVDSTSGAERPALVSRQTQIRHSQPDADLVCPTRDAEGDRRFVKDLLLVLKDRSSSKRNDMGRRQALRILGLLTKAEYPTEDEALFLSGQDALQWLQPGKFWKSIIVTTGQQALPLQTVEQFLGEFYEDKVQVWIQDPKVCLGKNPQITRQVKIGKVKERLLSGDPTDKPWNLLELAAHCDDGLRPAFLNTEDARLLTKLKVPNGADHARRRVYEQGYKEVEKWALVAEAGALTEPHQDSHGYSTFITINQGIVGFGWLCSPTPEEREEWRQSPAYFVGGKWRYVVLKPGQTVFFPAGTVHFVFRSPAEGNSLAFGGHVLRCSNIIHWVKTLIEERNSKEITNEDLTDSASGYLARVEKFVLYAKVTKTEEKWGGAGAIEEFLKLKKEFTKKRQNK